MNSYIYEITNVITQEQYIGIRKCLGDIYCDKYKGENTIISKDFRKYGKKNFVKRVLAIIIDEEMEQSLIDLYISHSKYKLIKECSKEELSIRRSSVDRKSSKSRKIICLNTGETFDSISEAARKYKTDRTGIVHACSSTSEREVAGKDSEGNYLKWQYYDEYLAENNGE